MIHLLLAVIYLSFIGLGLPDSLLGSAWPAIYSEMGVPVSFMGVISMIISIGTVISSLQNDRLSRWLGTGKVTLVSTAMTAIALFGFSISRSFWQLCLWAIPYGLGAGSVDAALNNFVALNYASCHMSWLHCMWGLGAAVGPYAMGYALTGGQGWNAGYRYIAIIQFFLSVVLLFSLPMWKKTIGDETAGEDTPTKSLSLRQIAAIPGAKAAIITFFCYCALEQTTALWGSSYLVLHCGMPAEKAAGYASLFFIGVTIGRGICGFLTIKLNNVVMIRLGESIVGLGIAALLLPLGETVALIGLTLIGLGCAPIYPCMLHATPENFGRSRSQAIIGVQMASAFAGSCLMPPLFGLLVNHIGAALLPLYLALILVLMVAMYELLLREMGRT